MRKETSQKAFVNHSIPSRKFDVANKQKIKELFKRRIGYIVGIKHLYKLANAHTHAYWIKSLVLKRMPKASASHS